MSDAHDDGRETITLWVEMPAAAHPAAEALAKTYAEEGAEEVLAALALDLAALRAGRRGLRLSWVLGWLVCEPWPRGDADDGAKGGA
jgi:hypothetical protein